MKRKVTMKEMEDDNSQYMKELSRKFEQQYGKELEQIIANSHKRVDSRMGRDSNTNRRCGTRRV